MTTPPDTPTALPLFGDPDPAPAPAIDTGLSPDRSPVATTRGLREPVEGAVLRWTVVPSPIDDLLLVGDGESLTALHMRIADTDPYVGPDWRHDPGAFRDVTTQLAAYFAGELTVFDVSLAPTGTAFQRSVWSELLTVPYGHTASYGRIATALGHPTASRAVGAANGRNPIAVIVPCHRVIGANGSLTGYAGGLTRKQRLLALERGTAS